ncbi:alpha/beta hydrolase [Streptomyces sp. NPDC020141]|uniref:alpha/beta hydrolase n=1 Tax=Streptomyces sp. NPDC020141 TaxID=3365065 RepID=UPI0037AD1503
MAVSVFATLTPGLATAAPAAPPAPASPVATPAAQYPQQKPVWKRCAADEPASFQCATIRVPLNYAKPGGKKIGVEISRIKATSPSERRGVLLFNPGGPGGEGLGMSLDMSRELPASVRARYDLIGFDPRGIGRSTPVRCGLADSQKSWPRPYKADTYAQDVSWAKSVADKCRAKVGDTLKHITTRNTARDMDVIRAALGEKKLNYLGYSYGTYLGSVYTQMFPKRADRFVLDSAVDPEKAWRETFRIWGPEVEPAFDRWTEWTAGRSAEYQLGDTPEKVAKTFWDLVAHADRKPIVIGKTAYDGDMLRYVMRSAFFSVRVAAESTVILRDAAAGKPVPEQPDFGPIPDNHISAQWAVLCGDTRWNSSAETYRKEAARDAARYPLFGDHSGNITPCAFWGRTAEPRTKVDNKAGALIVQNEWDSQTPLSTARGMHRAMKGSKLVTVDEGEGHGVYLYGKNACADKVANAYLNTGKLPAKDVTCKAAAGKRGSQQTVVPAPKPPLQLDRG